MPFLQSSSGFMCVFRRQKHGIAEQNPRHGTPVSSFAHLSMTYRWHLLRSRRGRHRCPPLPRSATRKPPLPGWCNSGLIRQGRHILTHKPNCLHQSRTVRTSMAFCFGQNALGSTKFHESWRSTRRFSAAATSGLGHQAACTIVEARLFRGEVSVKGQKGQRTINRGKAGSRMII